MEAAELTGFDREMLRTLVGMLDDTVIATELDGTIVAWNAAAERLMGYRAADAIGRNYESIDSEEAPRVRAEMLAQIASGNHDGVSFVRRQTDGSTLELHTRAAVIRDSGHRPLGILTIAHDETERHRAHKAEAQLAAIVTSSDLAIVGKSREGTITSWNQGAELLFGWAAEEVVGRHIGVVVPHDHLPYLENVMDRVARGERPGPFDALRRHKDGTIFEVAVLVSPVHDEAGKVAGFAAITRDVTEQRRRERHETELELRLANVQRLESLGRLAGGVAHDFNNLLAVMLNSTDFVREAILNWSTAGAGEPPPLLLSDLDEIRRAAQRAASLTRQLLTFGRRDHLRPEPLDLNGIVRDLQSLLARTLGSDIELEVALQPALPYVVFDQTQLEHLMLNLATNARDAMPLGGRLTIATVHPATMDAEDATDFVTLSVTDTGTGMAPDVRSRAFEPFFTTKEQGKGTGLGLATAYGVVTQVGGSIELDSEVGAGTCVRVQLPATTAAPETTAPPPAPNLRGKGERVLVAEDVDAMRELVRRLLVRNGYAVVTATDGMEALGIVERDPAAIDLLLSDVVMPRMRGDQLEQAVHAHRADLPVLLMSGFAHVPTSEAPREPPSPNVLEKPFTETALLEQVRRLLDNGR